MTCLPTPVGLAPVTLTPASIHLQDAMYAPQGVPPSSQTLSTLNPTEVDPKAAAATPLLRCGTCLHVLPAVQSSGCASHPPPPPHTHSLSSSPVHPAAPRSRGAAGATCPFTPAGAAPECLVPQGMARAGLLAQRPQGSNSRGLPAHIRVTLHTHTCTPAVALLRPLSLPAGGTGTTASPTVA
jgi:hypothetical protein